MIDGKIEIRLKKWIYSQKNDLMYKIINITMQNYDKTENFDI